MVFNVMSEGSPMQWSSMQSLKWCVEANLCVGPLGCPIGKAVVQRYPFRCPTKHSEEKGKRYTDALGRSLYAFSLALKDTNVTACLRNIRPDIGKIRAYWSDCDENANKCASLLAVSDEAKAIYIAYGGTTTKEQMSMELVNGFGAQLGAWEKFESSEAGVVSYFHKVFYKVFIDSGMKDELLSLNKKYPAHRIWITGHSMGASLASMTALYLSKKQLIDKNLLRLITFGEPRTGNVAYARDVEENIEFRYRVVKRNDFIASIPRSVDPTTSLITATMFERQPLFYRYLVHYDNNMSKGTDFKVCDLSDDFGCRNTMLAFDLIDHMSYFNINSDDFLAKKCPREMLF
ncbi:triacylglycerol lipase [Dictyocaulus viviparus]|uniref:Triacylglycerol lipase n=1 Tax=Dictyocaulus viviparus TaxID=29172 RepID=A0A0D8XG51_DICVI|nr:triacylglycerol lipase [Dictyocaulus viviparus]